MFRKLFRKALKPIVGKATAAVLSRAGDDMLKRELDKRTGGIASKIDDAI